MLLGKHKNFSNNINAKLLWQYFDLICRGVAQFGSARGLGPWGREFESLHPDH